MSLIYLIRHGQASFGQDDYDRLSPLGRRQSRALAKHLTDTGFRLDAVYCGPLRRHRDTTDEFLAVYEDCAKNRRLSADVNTLAGFDEYDTPAIIRAMITDAPSLEDELPRMYSSRESFRRIYETAMLRWVEGRFDGQGVERWEDLQDRVARAVKTIMSENGRGKNIAVFTSGGAISASLSNVLRLSAENAMRLNWQIVNTSVTSYMYNDERLSLAGFNSVSHLELARDPSLITYR